MGETDPSPAVGQVRCAPARVDADGAGGPRTGGALTIDHAILAAALDPLVAIDDHGVIQFASDSMHRVFGWTPDELIGRNISVIMPEPHRSVHDGYLDRYRRTGETSILGHTRQFEAVRKNGQKFPVEVSVSRVEFADGQHPLFVGILRDISDRNRVERELRLMRNLALAIPTASSFEDALVRVLREICEITSWDYGEVWLPTASGDELELKGNWATPGSGLDRLMATCQRRFQRGHGIPGRAWDMREPMWIDDLLRLNEDEFCRHDAARAAGFRAAAAAPILSKADVTAVLAFFVRDPKPTDSDHLLLVRTAAAPLATLIERRRAEEALSEYRYRLEDMVADRTRELQQSLDRLRFADRLASIGTLAAGLGHDMHNVLLPVKARLNALRAEVERAPNCETALGHIDALRKHIAYLQQLADGLHYLASDPDVPGDERHGLRLSEWWSEVGALISRAVPKHVAVRARFPADLPAVRVPASGLTQSILNLVVNAGEAIPIGRKRVQGLVKISAKPSADRRWVRLSVADNGVGMTEEVKRRAFDLFFTTKPRGLGTGLGLPLVRKVVDQIGGTIHVESDVGKGTTVTLALPVVADTPHPHRSRPVAAVLVDDDRLASLVAQIVIAAGADVIEGCDTDDARLWIVEPKPQRLDAARAWTSASTDRYLVLLGTPESSLEDWRSLASSIIERSDEFETVRNTLFRIVTTLSLAESSNAESPSMFA